MKKIAISLFDYTGNMLKPWLEAGYECHIYDIQHPRGTFHREDGMITHYADLSEPPPFLPHKVDFMAGFPPCTDVAVSGARWMRGKGLRALQQSIGYFATCAEVADMLQCPYMIENPVSTISTYWREPDHKFHPAWYAGYSDISENYTKETWLWVSDDPKFVMPPRQSAGDLFEGPDVTYIHHQSPGPERANIRSATPMGFARAVFEANSDSATPSIARLPGHE